MPESTQTNPLFVLRDEVGRLVASSGTIVIGRVKTHLVEEVLKNRVAMLLQGFNKRDEAQQNLRKIKPDQIAYDETGKEVSKTYSKPKLDELNKAKETLDRLDKALESAMSEEKPDFEGLKKFVSGPKDATQVAPDKSE